MSLIYQNGLHFYDYDNIYKLLNYLNIQTNNKHTISLETNGIVNDMHLGELGHIKQAEYFYNYIKTNMITLITKKL